MRASHAIDFSPVPARRNIEVPALSRSDLYDLSSTDKQFDFIEEAARILRINCAVRFRIGNRIDDADEAFLAAKSIAEGLSLAIERYGAPSGMCVEVDRAQATHVPEGFKSRTLLPHRDAAHVSYLTPSRLDDSNLNPSDYEKWLACTWRRQPVKDEVLSFWPTI